MSIRCPVCDKGGLQSTSLECPQCNADLEAFQLLDTLQEASPAGDSDIVSTEPDRMYKEASVPNIQNVSGNIELRVQTLVYLMVFVVITSSLIAVGMNYIVMKFTNIMPQSPNLIEPLVLEKLQKITHTQSDIGRVVTSLKKRFDEQSANISKKLLTYVPHKDYVRLNKRLVLLEQRSKKTPINIVTKTATANQATNVNNTDLTKKSAIAHAHTATVNPEFIQVYRFTKTDTLWDIAKKYYGKGHLYPALLALNPGLGVLLHPGQQIRLPINQEAAKLIFPKIVVTQNKRKLLRYPVVAGDTWKLISKRLYGNSKAAAKLKRLNGGNPKITEKYVLIPF
ncbi:hypothetical protein TI05_13125 [Achromatium sp. WMS3]|nr:hypothetical protein TI05_13125 [Achromatium sp. WMS3]